MALEAEKRPLLTIFIRVGFQSILLMMRQKKLMQSSEIVAAVKSTFGDIVFENGNINREKLAEIVFNEPFKLAELNAIVHPAVKRHFKQWLLENEAAEYIIYETAILFESGSYKDCDLIITITAPVETRIQRVLKRDKTTREAILKRMDAQWSDEKRTSKSDFVVENSTIENAKREVDQILKILKIKQKHT